MSIPESALNYGSILTLLGENAEVNGKLNNKSITFTHIAIGDGNDQYVQPSRTQTTLVNEITRIPVTGMEKIEPSEEGGIPQLKVWAKIPDNIVDVAVREFAAIAVYDGNPYLHAVGNSVRIPILSGANNGGEVNDIYIEMTFAVTSLDPIIMIDPTIVTATRKYVDNNDKAHVDAADPHPQYMKYGDSTAIWTSMPIGHPFALELHILGVEPPPTDNPKFRYIKLSSNDIYNIDPDGRHVLINEMITGTSPTLSVTAEVNYPGSPMHGQRIELRNTSKVFSRAGENCGIVVGDAIRNITAFVSLSDESLPNSLRGFANHSGAFKSTAGLSSIHAVASKSIGANVYPQQKSDVNLDASLVVPTANQNQPVHIEEPLFERIF